MKNEWDMVREFHLRFNHPIGESPMMLEADRVNKRGKWMQEELNEFFESVSLYEQADAMIDLIYFALGTLVEMGIPPNDLFAIVHEANMGKLWEDGTPHYNADGKTIKPETWVDPEPKFIEIIEKLKLGSSE
jgi:predicted HAD superfamily Cof-like phosphohydrolase